MRKVSAAFAADGRRDNAHIEFMQVLRQEFLSLSRLAPTAPPSGGAEERSQSLPSSDEEGVSATCRADGRRDNVSIEFRRSAGSAKRVLSLSHRSAMPAPFSSRVLLAARD